MITHFVVALATMVIGTLAGISACFLGKLTDDVIMRTVDVLLVIPGFKSSTFTTSELP